MLSREKIESQLPHCLDSCELPELGQKIEGKVRDSYVLGDKRVLVTSDRLSAFDVVLSTIPFKGKVLNDMAAFWFDATSDIAENHLLGRPHPNIFISKQVEILPIEVIIRGYLTGSAWRDYQVGKDISGISLPEGMPKSTRFDTPLITPSTKAERGEHDMPISSEEIVSSGLVEKTVWEEVCEKALLLFERGTQIAEKQGLILVDTKYEFGILSQNGKTEVILADEIHTPDSSRYWIKATYKDAFREGSDPKMLDKEFVRRELIKRGFSGEGKPPILEDSFRVDTAERYMEAYESITGKSFEAKVGPIKPELKKISTELKQQLA